MLNYYIGVLSNASELKTGQYVVNVTLGWMAIVHDKRVDQQVP